MRFYPLKFQPIYKEKIWGGSKIARVFQRKLPNDKIGESWEIAAHPHGTSIISNGRFQGQKITDLIQEYTLETLGEFQQHSKFPLLVKILDANAKLSVQVHPNDEYARRVEGELGKTEMWYIIEAKPGAKLIYGLKPGTDRKKLAQAIREGKIEDFLNEVEVKQGDVFFMPAGTVHAIEDGILLAEIQQNSDTTYRLYDWNRLDANGQARPLHIEQALEVIDYNNNFSPANYQTLSYQEKSYTRSFLAACPYFVTEKIEIRESYQLNPAGKRFYILLNLAGEGTISSGQETITLKPGETIFLPASLPEVKISGQISCLLTYLPQNKGEIQNLLTKLGFSREEQEQLPGFKNWN